MELRLPRDFDPARAGEILDRARPQLNLPPDARLEVTQVKTRSRGTQIQFTAQSPTPLSGPNLGPAEGVTVEVNGHGALEFDKQGRLVKASYSPDDPHQLDAVRANLANLAATNQIYVALAGEQVNPDVLRQQGKSWYVEQDADGRRRLKRAFIA